MQLLEKWKREGMKRSQRKKKQKEGKVKKEGDKETKPLFKKNNWVKS